MIPDDNGAVAAHPALAVLLAPFVALAAASDAEIISILRDAGADAWALTLVYGLTAGGWPVAAAAIVWLILRAGKVPEIRATIQHKHELARGEHLRVVVDRDDGDLGERDEPTAERRKRASA
jgi:hypothetical protein